MKQNEEYEILKILGEPNRFRILKLLLGTQEEICNCEFVDSLRIPKYGLSKHLDILIKAGLIRFRKEGRWVYYSGCINNESNFCNAICKAIQNAKGPIYSEDLARFKKRLHIRKEGKCVLGVQGKKLMKCC